MDVHITELVRAFRDLGHDMLMVGPDRGSDTDFGRSGAAVSRVRQFLPRVISEALEIVYDRLAFRRLERAYLQFQPDILYERHNLFLTAGKRLHEKYGIPYLLEVNSPLAAEREAHGGLALKRFATAQEAAVWRSATHLFPVSGVLSKILQAADVDPNRITVVHNAVNPQMFHEGVDGSAVRAQYGLVETDVVLGFTGFIRPWHGLDRVIDALATSIVPTNTKLFIVGDGPHRSALEQQALALGVQDRVTFAGLVSRRDMPSFIAAFDIALQPAVTPYASPLKLFEYMALGKAIIAPDQENIREILDDAEGVFYSKDSSDLALLISQASHCEYKGPVRRWSENVHQILQSLVAQ